MRNRMRITASLVRCGRCGKSYGPRGHTCVTSATSKRRRTRGTLKPSLSLTCSKCGKPLGNPLTHTCRVRTDWKKRTAGAARQRKTAQAREKRTAWQKAWIQRQKDAAARRRAAEKARRKATVLKQREAAKAKRDAARKRTAARTHDRERHEPQTCPDQHCHRYPCRLWREAHEAGRMQGLDEGFAKGYGDGYAAGYPDGMRDCPLPHRW
jgi:hypothetical protein